LLVGLVYKIKWAGILLPYIKKEKKQTNKRKEIKESGKKRETKEKKQRSLFL